MKIKTLVEINLMEIPVTDWPVEARELAFSVLRMPKNVEQMKKELFPKAWLVAKMEQYQQNDLELESFLGV